MKIKNMLLVLSIIAIIVSSSGCAEKADGPADEGGSTNSPGVEASMQPSASPDARESSTNDQESKSKAAPSSDKTVKTEPGLTAYENSTYKFKIRFPEGWDKKEDVMGTVVCALSPKEGDEDKFQANFNVLVQDLSAQPMTLQEYTDLSLKQIKQLITNCKIEVSEEMTLGGKPGYKIAYTGDQGVLHLYFSSAYTIKDNKAYLITFTCEQDKNLEYSTIIDKVFNSFEFK